MNLGMDLSTPTVSVLLSTYNGTRWLPELIASIEAQTHTRWQVLVRDDGSSDATTDLIESWAHASERVRFDAQRTHMGPSGSFMSLLNAVDTPYFAFCDQDDVWHPDRLEVGLSRLSGSDPQVDEIAVATGVDLVDERLSPISSRTSRHTLHGTSVSIGPMLLNNIAIGATMLGSAALARSAVRLAADHEVAMHDWWCALVATSRGSMLFEPRSTLQWRRHQATVTGGSPPGLGGRLDRRRVYLLGARNMAKRILVERDAVVSEEALIALEAVAAADPHGISFNGYRRLSKAGVRATSWNHRATLLAACLDPSGRRAPIG
jgi:glycosyltransferase involved in cell wall biosynthesis